MVLEETSCCFSRYAKRGIAYREVGVLIRGEHVKSLPNKNNKILNSIIVTFEYIPAVIFAVDISIH